MTGDGYRGLERRTPADTADMRAGVLAGGILVVVLAVALAVIVGRPDGLDVAAVTSMHGASVALALVVVVIAFLHGRSLGRTHGTLVAVASVALGVAAGLELFEDATGAQAPEQLRSALGLTAAVWFARVVWGPEVDTRIRFGRECLMATATGAGLTLLWWVAGPGDGWASVMHAVPVVAWSVVAVGGLHRWVNRGWLMLSTVAWAAVAFAVGDLARWAAVSSPRWPGVAASMLATGLLLAALGGAWALADAVKSHRSDVLGTRLDSQTKDDEADRRLRELTHELRNAVFVVEGASETLVHRGSRADDDTVRDLQRIITDGMATLRELVTNSAYLQDGAETFRLDAVVSDCAAAARARGVPVEVPRSVPAMVRGRRSLTARALVNLMLNAERHGGAAPGRPLVVTVGVDPDQPAHVVARVRDSGPGIPAGLRERAFAEGEQVGPDRSGDGVGLSVARQLARRQGGDVWYEEPDGGGACLVLSLPLTELVTSGAPGQLRDSGDDPGEPLHSDTGTVR